LLTGLDIGLDGFQAIHNLLAFIVSQYINFAQHGSVSDGTPDVMSVQALVELNGSGELGDKGIGGFGKAATPGGVGIESTGIRHEHRVP
jgi:hypothetical protein